jgi:hypothetical protein
VAGHDRRDPGGVLLAEALLAQHVGDLGLRLARPLGDLLALAQDLGVEDLTLALGTDVLAGGHAEHARESGRDTGDDDRERLARGPGDGGDHGERGHQPVLRPEHDLADLAQQRARAPLVGEVAREPRPGVGGGRRIVRGPGQRLVRHAGLLSRSAQPALSGDVQHP